MIHRTIVKDGVARMVHASRIELPPKASLIFAPGGYHLMLMNPKPALRAGDTVGAGEQAPKVLRFQSAGLFR